MGIDDGDAGRLRARSGSQRPGRRAAEKLPPLHECLRLLRSSPFKCPSDANCPAKCAPRELQLAARIEIAAAEQVGGGDYGRPHGPVFVSALRPGQLFIQPEIETHAPMVTAVNVRRSGHIKRLEQLFCLEWLAKGAGMTERTHEGGIRSGGQVQDAEPVRKARKLAGRIGDQDVGLQLA